MRRRIRRRLRSVLHRSRVERELDLELQFHLDMLAAQKARAGLPPAAAERAARQAFGAVAGIKDDVRDVWLGRRIEAAFEDVRYGVRTLRAAPGFAFAIILTIALAVGINTAIFATAYALLLRPLPFDAPEQLVVLHHGSGSPGRSAFSVGELELSTRWLVRSSLPSLELQERVRAVVAAMDREQPVDDFRSLESFRDDRLLPSRVTASVVGLFGVLALVITAAGIAGVVGYAVQQRRREFGVRLALGAPRTRVLGMVLGQGLSMVALGLFAGACASLPILPLIRALPADSARFDPLALGLAAVVLLTVAAAACLVPALRAARVDPLVVLRCE